MARLTAELSDAALKVAAGEAARVDLAAAAEEAVALKSELATRRDQCDTLAEFSDAQAVRVHTLTAERDVLIAQLASSKASSRAEEYTGVSAQLAEAQRALAEAVAKGAHERDMLHWKLTTSQTQCGVLEGQVLAVTQRVEELSAARDALKSELQGVAGEGQRAKALDAELAGLRPQLRLLAEQLEKAQAAMGVVAAAGREEHGSLSTRLVAAERSAAEAETRAKSEKEQREAMASQVCHVSR